MAAKEQRPFFSGDLPGSPPKDRELSQDDITNQGRYLLNNFIYDRMQTDGIQNVLGMDELQDPGTPLGPPMEHVLEIGRALRFIGDDLDKDQNLQDLVARVPPEAERQTLLNVAKHFFDDEVFTWGRVVALFYFAYKICIKALDRIPLIRGIINLIVDFLRDNVARWILDRGGWESIREYFGTTTRQVSLVVAAGVVACAGVYIYKNF